MNAFFIAWAYIRPRQCLQGNCRLGQEQRWVGASALAKSAEDGFAAGTTETEVDLAGIYDLRLLNAVLADLELDVVSAGGLGED